MSESSLAETLRAARAARGWTVQQLALAAVTNTVLMFIANVIRWSL